jgi:hypothetical protein
MREDQYSTGNTAVPLIGSRAGPNLSATGGLSIAIKTTSTLDKYPGQSLGHEHQYSTYTNITKQRSMRKELLELWTSTKVSSICSANRLSTGPTAINLALSDNFATSYT